MKNLSSASIAAKQIRESLKMNFPNIKFSVKSETYSGGDSIRVSWNFGVTQSEVDAIINHWKDGQFNSMEDIYEKYSGTKYHNNSKGEQVETNTVKYVFSDRKYEYAEDKNTYNQQGKNDTEKFVCVLHNVEYSPNSYNNLSDGHNDNAAVYARNILGNTQFPSDKIQINGLSFNDEVTSWSMSELHKRYILEFTNLATVK